nr:MAG TPA: hypothetical protein [Caudoviricetes sp.]DAZ28844.1 MAG TPA: hypothetical protein [Caudoviricetes sp.]
MITKRYVAGGFASPTYKWLPQATSFRSTTLLLTI